MYKSIFAYEGLFSAILRPNVEASLAATSKSLYLSIMFQNEDLYLLRFVGTDGLVHRTGLPACNLIQSGLSDVITVHLVCRLNFILIIVV